MASRTQDTLFNLFNEASGNSRADSVTGGGDLAHADSASGSSSLFNASGDSGPGQSYDGTSGTSQSAQPSGSSGSGLESLASTVFGGALGLVPLIGGLVGLFGGGGTQPPVFQKYEMPSPISFEAADVGGSLVNSSYGQMGLPRVYDSSDSGGSSSGAANAAPASATPASGGAGSVGSAGAPSGSAGSGAGAVTASSSSAGSHSISVNVQAMDAQSFMSYSGQIAQAVREAMLNLSSLNDVVSDL